MKIILNDVSQRLYIQQNIGITIGPQMQAQM